jgi:hypothetical protein
LQGKNNHIPDLLLDFVKALFFYEKLAQAFFGDIPGNAGRIDPFAGGLDGASSISVANI